MPTFKVIQITIESGIPTGKSEHYQARSTKEAAKKLLYTRSLKNGRCKLGPTGRAVSCGDGTSWVIARPKQSKRSSKR